MFPRRMRIGIPKETVSGERRVAMVPDVAKRLIGAGHEIVVERGAGEQAAIPDEALEQVGVTLGDSAAAWGADVVCKVARPTDEETSKLGSDTVLIGFLNPLGGGAKNLAPTGATTFAMEAIPRISRAQSMDALSSQATVGGYLAVLIGA